MCGCGGQFTKYPSCEVVHHEDADPPDSDDDDADDDDNLDRRLERKDHEELPGSDANVLPDLSLADAPCRTSAVPSDAAEVQGEHDSIKLEPDADSLRREPEPESLRREPEPSSTLVSAIPPDIREMAEAELERSATGLQMKAFSDAADILRKAGVIAEAQALEQRAHIMLRNEQSVQYATRLFLKARSAQRQEQVRLEQAEIAKTDAATKELELRYKTAKAHAAAKQAESGEIRALCRRDVAEANIKRQHHRDTVAKNKANFLYLQKHLAAYLVKEAQALVNSVGKEYMHKTAVDLRKTKAWTMAMDAIIEPIWCATMHTGYRSVTQGDGLTTGSSTKKQKNKDWASESLARALFGNRDPVEAKTVRDIRMRLRDLFQDCMPGYNEHYFRHHGSDELLERCNHNIDVAFLSGMQRYCMVLPEADFPSELRTWPWNEKHIGEWVDAHRARNEDLQADRPRKRPRRPSTGSATAVPVKRERQASKVLACSGASPSLGACSGASPSTSASSWEGSCIASRPDSARKGHLFDKWNEAP